MRSHISRLIMNVNLIAHAAFVCLEKFAFFAWIIAISPAIGHAHGPVRERESKR